MTKQLAKAAPVPPPMNEDKPEYSMQSALLAIVQRTDIDPDRLEKFLDLQIKMENLQAERAFNEALAKFQGDCPIIKKSKNVKFKSRGGNDVDYNYSPLDEIVHVIKPILKEHGLAYSFDIKPGKETSTLLTTISHKDGFTKTSTLDFETFHNDDRMNLSQRRKSAISYTKRTGLENALGIVTAEEDDDARRAIDNPITQEQLDQIEKILSTSNNKDTREVTLKWLKVKDFKDLSEFEAKKAIIALKERRAACLK